MCHIARHLYQCAHRGDVIFCIEACEEGFDFPAAKCKVDRHEIVGYVERDELCPACRQREIERRSETRPELTPEERERRRRDDIARFNSLPSRYRRHLAEREKQRRRREDPNRHYRNALERHERDTYEE